MSPTGTTFPPPSILVAAADPRHLPLPRTLPRRRAHRRRGEVAECSWPASASRHVTQVLRRAHGRQGFLPRHRRRRVRRARRPVRLRQVDDAEDPGRASRRRRPGTVLIGERDVTDLAPGDRDIAMVFQNYALYPHLTVRRNMGFGLKMRGTPAAEIDAPRRGGRANPRHRAPARPPAEGPLRRAAAARGARPRHRARAAGLPDGRAAVESRRQAARPHPRRDQRPAQAPRRHDDLRHARPDRGDDDGRPHRHHARRRDPADRRSRHHVPRSPPTSSSRASSVRRA